MERSDRSCDLLPFACRRGGRKLEGTDTIAVTVNLEVEVTLDVRFDPEPQRRCAREVRLGNRKSRAKIASCSGLSVNHRLRGELATALGYVVDHRRICLVRRKVLGERSLFFGFKVTQRVSGTGCCS